MSTHLFRISACWVLLACSWIGQQPTATAVLAAEPCPDEALTRGVYNNYSFNFVIRIPEPLVGVWNSGRCASGPDGCTCMADHGRIIPRTPEPYQRERHIEVSAGYPIDPTDSTSELMASRWIAGLRNKGRKHRISIDGPNPVTLDRVNARRAKVRYYDPDLRRWTVEEFVVAVNKDSEYSLGLRTPEVSYGKDRAAFDSVVKSFRWLRQ